VTGTVSNPPSPLLAVKHLCVHFSTPGGALRAVDGVSFSLETGKTLGIVGESGCGKSMLCRSLLRLLPHSAVVPKEARVVFNGVDLLSLKEKKLRQIRGREIGIVLQDPLSSLHPLMKIGRQIAEPLIHHIGIHPEDARLKAVELLYTVGIPAPEKRADQLPHQLSGGMRQRVAVAMALACQPRLLIADEPTTALDVTVQAEILDLLAQLQGKNRMAMILVTHDMRVAAGRTHETAVMYAGKIVEQGPTETLFNHSRMPYTRALMAAIPRLKNPTHTRLPAINGQIPDPLALPAGCRFAPRCPKALPRCKEEEPPLQSNGIERHRFACWYPEGEGQ
jgi:oligopeptide/dipeptide ABC transporter ATP-binding protein